MTCCRAKRATKYVGSAEESPNGSSNVRTTSSTRASTFGRTISSVCLVPNAFATRAACGASLNSASGNPIEKVRTGWSTNRVMEPTTADESTPPERNAPSGTSDSRWQATDSLKSRRSSSIASAS